MAICDGIVGKIPPIWGACKAKDAVGDEVADAAGDAWQEIVHSFSQAAGELVKTLTTGWLGIDSPTLSASSGPVAFIFGHTGWLVAQLSVLTLLLTAGRMAWTQRAEGAREAAAAVLRVLVTQGAMVAGVNALLIAGDRFSVWIVNASTKCGGGENPTAACNKAFQEKIVAYTLLRPDKTEMLGMTLVIALLLIVASLVQIGFMLVRNAMVLVLVGTMPLSAAVSGTEQGRAWWQKSVSWLLAFILFKPVAGLVYATAFASLTQGDPGKDPDLMTQLSGVVLLVLAALTLPALMRIATPLVDAVAQGRGGGASGIMGGIGAVASGAVSIKTGGASKAASASSAGGKPGAGAKGAAGANGGGGGRNPLYKGDPSTSKRQTAAPQGAPSSSNGAQPGDPRTPAADPRTSGAKAPSTSAPSHGPTGTATQTRPPVSPPRQSTREEGGPSGSA